MFKSATSLLVVCFGGLIIYALIPELLAEGLSTGVGLIILAVGVVFSAGLYIYGKVWSARIPDDEEE